MSRQDGGLVSSAVLDNVARSVVVFLGVYTTTFARETYATPRKGMSTGISYIRGISYISTAYIRGPYTTAMGDHTQPPGRAAAGAARAGRGGGGGRRASDGNQIRFLSLSFPSDRAQYPHHEHYIVRMYAM